MVKPTPQDWAQSAKWYDENAEQYISLADARSTQPSMAIFTSHLPDGARVLDFGCGSGRDLKAFLDLGFDAHGIDGSSELIAHCGDKLGEPHRYRCMDFRDYDDPAGRWDGIWAMASLLHLPKAELPRVISAILKSLTDQGVFLAYLKAGDEEIIDDIGRPMNFLGEQEASDMINPLLSNNRTLQVRTISATASHGESSDWIEIMVHG